MIYFLNKEIKVLLKTNLYKKFCFFECVNKQFSTVSSQKPLKPLNILFFGTDKFATVCLKELLENRRVETMQKKVVNKVEVVCIPSHNVPVKQFVNDHNLVLHEWPDVPDLNTFDVGVVVSFGKLIPSSVINKFPYGMINVHGSLLPHLRGAAPIARAIERGFEYTGVSIMQIAPNHFDRGLILDRSNPVTIDGDMNAMQLSDKLALAGAELCLKTLRRLPEKLSKATPQTSINVSYAPKLSQEDCNVNWNTTTSNKVWNKFRAYGFDRTMNLRCLLNNSDKDIVVKLVELHPCSTDELSFLPIASPPGTILYRKRFKKLFIACKTGYISCSKLSVLGRNPCSAVGFRNGYLLKKIRRNEPILFKTI